VALERDALVALTQRIMDADGTEAEIDGMIELLERNVPHPAVTDLIFYPDEEDVTAEQIVERALAHRPVPL
jgi:hypothetical protein